MDTLDLQPMSASQFDGFMQALRQRYAQGRMRSNLLSEDEALAFTQKQWGSFIPQGQTSPGHHFFNLTPSGQAPIGTSWLFVDTAAQTAFIFELYLNPDARGQGIGRLALNALERFAREAGARTLGLNVFATNQRAKALYSSYGFRDVSTDMIKEV